MHDIIVSKSSIVITIDEDDVASICVQFEDAPASPNGKRLELSDSGSASNVRTWTNGTTLLTTDRHLNPGKSEYTRYRTAQSLVLKIRKASSPTDPLTAYDDWDKNNDPRIQFAHDSTHAVDQSEFTTTVRQYVYEDQGNRVIVTIVIQDDEGGGNGTDETADVIGDVLLRENKWALRMALNGEETLLSIDGITLSPLQK